MLQSSTKEIPSKLLLSAKKLYVGSSEAKSDDGEVNRNNEPCVNHAIRFPEGDISAPVTLLCVSLRFPKNSPRLTAV